MAIITPTVGRKVWYRPSEHDRTGPSPMQGSQDAPLDATIVSVHSDRMVNLLVVDAVARSFPVLSATLVQPGDETPVTGRYCEWMPFQVSTAQGASEMVKLPVIDQLGDVKSKLYLGIEEAIQLLSNVPAGDSEFVDCAFNKLREIQWCEVAAPARIVNEIRPIGSSQSS